MNFPIYLMPWRKPKKVSTTEPKQYYEGKRPMVPQMTAVITPEPPPLEKPGEPKVRKIITSMRVVNNRNVSISYYYKNDEGNPFGLTWNLGEGWITVVQKKSADGQYWQALGRFTEHSVTDVEWEYVTVAEDEPKVIHEPNEIYP